MTTKIEEVAKAMWFDFVDQHGYPNGLLTWDEMAGASEINDRREQFRSMAQAAIKAMKNPTMGMMKAARGNHEGEFYLPHSLFNSMIDAALSEEKAE